MWQQNNPLQQTPAPPIISCRAITSASMSVAFGDDTRLSTPCLKVELLCSGPPLARGVVGALAPCLLGVVGCGWGLPGSACMLSERPRLAVQLAHSAGEYVSEFGSPAIAAAAISPFRV